MGRIEYLCTSFANIAIRVINIVSQKYLHLSLIDLKALVVTNCNNFCILFYLFYILPIGREAFSLRIERLIVRSIFHRKRTKNLYLCRFVRNM